MINTGPCINHCIVFSAINATFVCMGLAADDAVSMPLVTSLVIVPLDKSRTPYEKCITFLKSIYIVAEKIFCDRGHRTIAYQNV